MTHFQNRLRRAVLVSAAVLSLLIPAAALQNSLSPSRPQEPPAQPLLLAQNDINPYTWTPVNSTAYTHYGKYSSDEGPTYSPEVHVPDAARKEYESGVRAAKKNSFKDAEEHLTRAATLYPPYSSAFAALGTAYAMDHDDAKAETAFAQALKLNPFNAVALHNYGNLLVDEGKLQDAEQELISICTMYPNDIPTFVRLGYLQLQLKENDAALATAAYLEKGGFKRLPFVHLANAIASEQKGDRQRAAKEYREYLKKPDTPQGKTLAEQGLARVENH